MVVPHNRFPSESSNSDDPYHDNSDNDSDDDHVPTPPNLEEEGEEIEFHERPGSSIDSNNDDNNNNMGLQLAIATSNSADNDVMSHTSTSSKPRSPKAAALAGAVIGTVVPRMEALPKTTFLLLSLAVAMPSALYILCFTKLGMGLDWFYYLADHYGEDWASTMGGATALYFLIMYILDADAWTNYLWLQRFCGMILVLGVISTVLFMVGDYPYGPICLFAALTPLWLITLNQLNVVGRIRTRVYVNWLSGPLFFVSVLVGLTWLIWTFVGDENEYNTATKAVFAQATGCEPNLIDFPECSAAYAWLNSTAATIAQTTTVNPTTMMSSIGRNTTDNITAVMDDDLMTTTGTISPSVEVSVDPNALCFEVVESPPSFIFADGCDPSCATDVFDDCLNGFILWAGPLLVSLVLFFLSFFCTFLRSDNSEKDIINFGKLWIFLLFAMWLTASLAGVAAGLSTALLSMTLASFVGSVIFVSMTRTRSEGKEQIIGFWARIDASYGAHLDVARGLFLVLCTPFIFIYVGLSIINQLVRKCGLPCSKELKTEKARKDFLTKRCRTQIEIFRAWDRTKVLTFAIFWGIAFMILQVIVAQFTVLFLSWLIEETSSMNLGVVTIILVGVGMIMFLLPPVPGVPIYLTLGVVIVATGRDILGIVGAMAYAAAASLGLKLLACTVQQKLIGESLSKSISVRKMTQINSTVIKAMRLILAQPGMGIDKVCILVGGPDWPTSVLCGIMGLDLLPVLAGTIPVIILILPTVLTGSFTYMAGLKTEDGEMEYPSAPVLATVFAAITAVVQFAAMILAAYYLEQTTSQRADELDAIEIDKEVAELEKGEVEFNNCYTRVTQWEVVPWAAQLTLYASFGCMVTCCYMVQLFSNACFADYQLTYTIEEHLDGNWLNLVKPTGWYAILLFFVSGAFLSGFVIWANVSSDRCVSRFFFNGW